MMAEKFFLYSVADQVIKITFLDSASVLQKIWPFISTVVLVEKQPC